MTDPIGSLIELLEGLRGPMSPRDSETLSEAISIIRQHQADLLARLEALEEKGDKLIFIRDAKTIVRGGEV